MSFAYLCLESDLDKCAGVRAPSGAVAPAGTRAALKSAARNAAKGADWVKMRWQNGNSTGTQLAFTANRALCLGVQSVNKNPAVVDLSACGGPQTVWVLVDGYMVHRSGRCLTVMKCVRRTSPDTGTPFCDATLPPNQVQTAKPPFVLGSYLALRPCSADTTQKWRFVFPGAPGTPSSGPTFSEYEPVSLSPTVTPSQKPTAGPSKRPSQRPLPPASTVVPTPEPTPQPSMQSPSKSPSKEWVPTNTLVPTAAPSAAFAEKNGTGWTPSLKAAQQADTFLWQYMFLLLIPACAVAFAFLIRKRTAT